MTELLAAEVRVVSIMDGKLDLSSREGELLFHISSALAQFERKRTGERCQCLIWYATGSISAVTPTAIGAATCWRTGPLLIVPDEAPIALRILREFRWRYFRQ
jgi:hypothetical protein